MSVVKPMFIYPMPYQFQLIQNVKTKSAYGYEALLRPESGMDARTYVNQRLMMGGAQQLELDTFFNASRQFFKLKVPGYLFINSLPNVTLGIHESKEFEREFGKENLSRIVMEILEYPFLDQPSWFTKQRFLIRHGMQVSLNSYGVGLNSDVNCVSFYHPNIVKLSYEMIHDFPEDPVRAEYVRSVVGALKDRNITVLAEGVETVIEYEMLKEYGIDLAQGYYIGMPGIPDGPAFIEDGDTETKFNRM